MNLPKVTIVTPSFNQAEFLERTILSVLQQDYPDIEYIIIDGSSTDGSIDIIKKYEDRLAWWISEKDNGQSNAINKGFDKATGTIYNWLNSDDILMPNAVSIAVHYLTKYPKYQMVFGDRVIISRNDQIMFCPELPSFKKTLVKYRIKVPQETAFIQSELWHKVNGLDEKLHYSMDADLWYRFLKHTNFYHIPFVLGAFRSHETSKSILAFGKERKTDAAAVEVKHLNTSYKKKIHNIPIAIKIVEKLNEIRLIFEKKSKWRKREIRHIISHFT